MVGRKENTQKALKNFLKQGKQEFPHKWLLQETQRINIAIAVSGGGLRAMLTTAGIMSALDARTPGTNKHLGGLLQSANYIGGVSGGSWAVMSSCVNDFKPMIELKQTYFKSLQQRLLPGIPDFDPGFKGSGPVQDYDIQNEEEPSGFLDIIMNFLRISRPKKRKDDVVDGLIRFILSDSLTNQEIDSSLNQSTGTNYVELFDFYKQVHLDASAKKKSSCFISLTDYWGRALWKSLFLNSSTTTFSSVLKQPSFKSYQQPFPILSSVQTIPKSKTAVDSHSIEITPFEFGSWDPYINGFVTTKYLGTDFHGGKPTSKACRLNYDDVGFLTATSSSLFNKIFVYVYENLINFQTQSETETAIHTILKVFGLSPSHNNTLFPQQHPDFAIISPSPFYKYKGSGCEVAESRHLYLADGGDDGQNIGFQPFLQPERSIDIILAYDMSSDLYNFPNGSSLEQSSVRYHNTNLLVPYFQIHRQFKQAVFPRIPSPVESDVFNSPIFLGCDLVYDYPMLSNITTFSEDANKPEPPVFPPVIVYTTNKAISYPSNTSTFKLSYTKQEIEGMMQNGYNLATSSNSTNFAACLRCALLKRQFDRINLGIHPNINKMEVPETCQECYSQYCWHNISNHSSSMTWT